jgi:hypothetical protein
MSDKVDHPKIQQLRRDVYTHCPEFSTHVNFEMAKLRFAMINKWLTIVRLELVGVPLMSNTYETSSDNQDIESAAEDEAIEKMWQLILELVQKGWVNFKQCSDTACKICADFGVLEEKKHARKIEKLKLQIAELEKQALPLKAQLAELESAGKK